MRNWNKFRNLQVFETLRLQFGTVIQQVNADGSLTTISLAEQAVLDGVTAGTVTASKAVVVDANKDISAFRDVTVRKLIGSTDPLNVNGLAAAQGGAVTVTGGTSSTSGNAGGAVNVTGGTPGATGVGGAVVISGAAGGATSGKGGAVTITAGAGTAGNASGGSITLTPGAKNGSGLDGVIRSIGVKFFKQAAQAAKTTSTTLTAAELLGGLITGNQGAAGAAAYTLPLATDLDLATPSDVGTDEAFEFSVINISTVAAEDITMTTNTGWTLVGNMVIQESAAATGALSVGTFRARRTGAGAWTLYRVG